MNQKTTGSPLGAVIWLTGLSGAGKSTLAVALSGHLSDSGIATVILDGDGLRQGISRDLGFSAEDRRENIRRAGEAAVRHARSGDVAIVALISPFRDERARVAARCQEQGVKFAEIFVNAPLSVCERRDPKQLYRKARAGLIKEMSGIDSPYEAPDAPQMEICTDRESVEASNRRLADFACLLLGREETALYSQTRMAPDFEKFRTLVMQDIALFDLLRAAQGREAFKARAVELGRARELTFSEEDVQAALDVARKTWFERLMA